MVCSISLMICFACNHTANKVYKHFNYATLSLVCPSTRTSTRCCGHHSGPRSSYSAHTLSFQCKSGLLYRPDKKLFLGQAAGARSFYSHILLKALYSPSPTAFSLKLHFPFVAPKVNKVNDLSKCQYRPQP